MNDQLISLSDDSLDQVAGGALISVDVTGTVKGVAKGVGQIGEAAFGLFGAFVKAGKQVAGAVQTAVGAIIEIK